MSTIYMIRHGQASFGKSNYDKLSENGAKQAQLLGEYICKNDIEFDAIFSGTLTRHMETTDFILSCYKEKNNSIPEITLIEEWNEYDSKEILTNLIPLLLHENPSLKKDVDQLFHDKGSFQRVFEATMFKWISGTYNSNIIIRWKDFVDQVNKGIDLIMKTKGRGKNIAVITSGGPISVAVKRALHLSDEDTMRITWQIVNTSVTTFKCTHDTIMLSSFNVHSHLELSKQKELITYR